ncbi:MAG TPA: phosphopantetheine-binding protein [Alphaproteobacteria bacterium]|jgi:acyl carrier protein
MTRDELKRVLLEEIGNVAPEVDPGTILENADLREALDIDSISFLNLIIALKSRLGVDVPELDYPKLRTLKHALDYLAARAPRS